jgi:hypothetical protein
MRRYIVLLLITGTVWAQTGLDKLVLKDGTYYQGKYVKTENKITYFEPQAVLDAKKDAKKWIAYPLLAGLTFASSTYGIMIIAREEPWESLPAMIGISTASLAVPYKVLNNLDKDQIEKLSNPFYDIELYKETFSEEFTKNTIIGFGLLGLATVVGYFIFVSTLDFGPNAFGPSSNAGFK